jgi:isoquinoline 1-oxidoreductase beta subunit
MTGPSTPGDAEAKKGMSRRKFVAFSATGFGVVLGAGFVSRPVWRRYLAGVVDTMDASYPGPTDPNAWFEIRADDSILLHSAKVEMGQGTFTGLAQIAADELQVDVARIRVVHAVTSTGNVDPFATGGSTSISSLWRPMREMAATMREMLRIEGARQMGVSPSAVTIEDGVLTSGDVSLTYGRVVEAAGEWEVPEPPPLKDPSTYRYVGRPVPRVDLREKVFGAGIFGMDAELPDMLHGALVRPDRIGGRLASIDASAAEAVPGVVRVVVEDDLVAVVGETFTAAEEGRAALRVEWEAERTWTGEDIRDLVRVGVGRSHVIQKEGRVDRAMRDRTVIEAEFRTPLGAHAQIEPAVAVVDARPDGATVMISTQVPGYTRREVADALGLDPEQVVVHPMYLGGGFGRRAHTPIAVDAARLSRTLGRPVKVVNSRLDEFRHDPVRPPTHHVLRGVLAEDGSVLGMEHEVASSDVVRSFPQVPAVVNSIIGHDPGSWRGGMIQYGAIPNHRVVSWHGELPFRTSAWRSLGLLANTFAIESFMDELAAAAGRDPVEFRLSHIVDDARGFRLREVIRTAAERSDWTTEVRDGRALGFAASTDANTPCAHVAEVSVEDGRIRVHRVTVAIDPGLAVNPDQIRAQCEGCVVMGLSAAMFEEMTIRDGALAPTIYGPYRMASLSDAPREIVVEILENADAPGAMGEPPLGPIGAAIANAVARLTGVRLRDIPLQPALDRALG